MDEVVPITVHISARYEAVPLHWLVMRHKVSIEVDRRGHCFWENPGHSCSHWYAPFLKSWTRGFAGISRWWTVCLLPRRRTCVSHHLGIVQSQFPPASYDRPKSFLYSVLMMSCDP